jgi:cardiolipin synthase
MQEAGCDITLFHPRTLKNIGVVFERDHRKIAVLDGRVAWVGGHCITDHWLGNAEDREHYRDISVRLRGPLVQAVQSAFSENWIAETGRLFVGDDVYPPLEPAGDVTAHVAMLKPEGSPPAVKLLHYAAICCAKKRIRIQNPYFIPEPDAIDALGRAVARGVDVQVMVPAAEASDSPMVQHTAHRNFDRLLASGVQMLEYRRTLLHQKVMVVDGVWCAVGSSNFDDRSFETNDEIVVAFYDAALARKLEEIFERDRPHCVPLDLTAWRNRGLFHRVQDNVLYLLNEVL